MISTGGSARRGWDGEIAAKSGGTVHGSKRTVCHGSRGGSFTSASHYVGVYGTALSAPVRGSEVTK